MPDINELSKTLGSMPAEALEAVVILAGFALAAYAIHAVITATKERR